MFNQNQEWHSFEMNYSVLLYVALMAVLSGCVTDCFRAQQVLVVSIVYMLFGYCWKMGMLCYSSNVRLHLCSDTRLALYLRGSSWP